MRQHAAYCFIGAFALLIAGHRRPAAAQADAALYEAKRRCRNRVMADG